MEGSKLEDARVFVTGAADGIGAALARAVRAAGARVFLCDVAEARLRETAHALDAPFAACDVRNATALARVVERAARDLGGLDLVCANAGVVSQGPILETTREELDWIFDINVHGVLHTVRPFVRLLREQRRPGRILITGSETSLSYPALIHGMQLTAYLMTKHAVLALAEGLRADLAGEGIGVSVLCPGPVATNLAQSSSALKPATPGSAKAGGGAAARSAGVPKEVQASLGALSLDPDTIAARALEGLRRGLFVIPTHPHIAEDVGRRGEEIRAGFAALPPSA